MAVELALLADEELSPCLQDEGLVQQAVDDVGVHPVVLGVSGFEMLCDVFVVLLELTVHGGTESASPGPPLHHVLDDGIGVRASLAAMGGLVVLVESVRTPEALVAVGARVFPPSLVELLFVSFPVKLALESLVAGGAPVAGFRDDRGRGAPSKWSANGGNGAFAGCIRQYAIVARACRGRRGDG